MRLAHKSPTPLDEDKSQDDVILDRQNIFAIDDVEVGAESGTEGRVWTVSHKDLLGVVFEDQLNRRLRYADTC